VRMGSGGNGRIDEAGGLDFDREIRRVGGRWRVVARQRESTKTQSAKAGQDET